jgi:glutamyl-tRNA synthetase
MKTVRTRFAPSPTGYMHVGGARTALFAWLISKQNKGQFILRIEDTDQVRGIEGAENHIIESLKWLGLDWDEGPDIGGDYGPYRQSNRLDIYKLWAEKLIESGRAYADPYTQEQVNEFRSQAQTSKQPFLYRNHRPKNPPQWDGSKPLRFKSEPKSYVHNDAVMGQLSTGPEVIDDFVLIKSDGYPTYNFAHIVDDAEMQITHIIRGQEFLASIPNYLNLYEALKITSPVIATVPHVLGPDSKKKLSKRDGAKDILDYREQGYPSEAINNFLASMGWNDGTEQEIFSIVELVQKFHLDQVQRSPAAFDERRLLWISGAHIRQMDFETLWNASVYFWPEEANEYPKEYKQKVLKLLQERLKYLSELAELARFFFVDMPIEMELINTHKQLKKLPNNELKNLLTISMQEIEQSNFSVQDLTDRLNKLLEQTNQKPGVLFSLIRIAITQSPASPGLAETLATLGKEVSINRVNSLIKYL